MDGDLPQAVGDISQWMEICHKLREIYCNGWTFAAHCGKCLTKVGDVLHTVENDNFLLCS